jgi:hypothetical protein
MGIFTTFARAAARLAGQIGSRSILAPADDLGPEILEALRNRLRQGQVSFLDALHEIYPKV